MTGTAGRDRDRLGWKLLLACLPLSLFLLLPCVAVLLRVSTSEVLGHLFDPQASQAMALSIVTTLITTVVTVVAGTPLAYALARKKIPGKNLLDTLVDLPMVLPPSVAGIALLLVFGRRGMLGPWLSSAGLDVAFTTAAVVMAQLFVSSSFYVKSAAAGFAGVDRELERAAELDGASPWKIFRTITIPMSAQPLLSGAVMTWARALGEFGATIIFAGNFPGKTQTMPLAIYMGFEIDLKVALGLAAVLMVVSFGLITLMKRLLRQSMIVW